MKTRYALAALCAVALTAAAKPPRPVHLDIPTAQSVEVLSGCIEKQVGAPSKEVPAEGGGVVIEVSQAMNLFHKAPFEYWTIAPRGGVNHLTLAYRHPMSEKTAAKLLRIVGRKCFPYELEAAGGGRLGAAGPEDAGPAPAGADPKG